MQYYERQNGIKIMSPMVLFNTYTKAMIETVYLSQYKNSNDQYPMTLSQNQLDESVTGFEVLFT